MIRALLSISVVIWTAIVPAGFDTGRALAEEHDATVSLNGMVVNESGEPVGGATVRVRPLDRTVLADSSGRFVLPDLPDGHYQIECSHVGYHNVVEEVQHPLPGGEFVRLVLRQTAIELNSQIVFSGRFGRSDSLGRRVSITGTSLREEMSRTVADVLEEEPGAAQRSMGPAPARPVLRGLGGNRLLVLENGQTAGDLSATSADHAVTIDPIGSRRVDVIRGPLSFRYGSNILGGVINVEDGRVPALHDRGLEGEITGQVESVNDGAVGHAFLSYGTSRVAVTGHVSERKANDIRTPRGDLENTSIATNDITFGATVDLGRLISGASVERFDSDYGIPGGFLGGHPRGVDIELEKERITSKSVLSLASSKVTELHFNTSYTSYYHRELESSGICGVSFGVLTYTAELVSRIRLTDGGRTAIGIHGGYRNYQQGCLTFVPETEEQALATWVIHHQSLGAIDVSIASRFDWQSVSPQTRSGTTTKAGLVRGRTFHGMSGGLALNWSANQWLSLGSSLMLTQSLPATEELFSDGPHLAAYSYEVGNADLSPERGFGIEVSATVKHDRSSAGLAVFRNRFANYIFPRNTGELEIGPGEEGFLVRYQYAGQYAEMIGGEFEFRLGLPSRLSIGGNASYVRGELLNDGSPIPFMPPLNGRVWGAIDRPNWRIRAALRWASDQDRLGEFEEGTAGWAVVDISANYQLLLGGMAHSLVLGIENLSDHEYRKHLSRVKSVMPEPGRNVKLLYRISF